MTDPVSGDLKLPLVAYTRDVLREYISTTDRATLMAALFGDDAARVSVTSRSDYRPARASQWPACSESRCQVG